VRVHKVVGGTAAPGSSRAPHAFPTAVAGHEGTVVVGTE